MRMCYIHVYRYKKKNMQIIKKIKNMQEINSQHKTIRDGVITVESKPIIFVRLNTSLINFYI